MSSCSGNCSSCGSDCADRKAESLLAPANPNSNVKKVIAVVSGKGGVGKSTVTSMLAVAMARKGKKVGVLDADITGPSVPKAFGVSECEGACEAGLYPGKSRGGIEVMSINLLLDDPSAPVLWRGPVIAGAVKQFWTDVIWVRFIHLTKVLSFCSKSISRSLVLARFSRLLTVPSSMASVFEISS